MLANFALEDHDQNVIDVLDSMQLFHDQTIHSGGQDDDLILKVLNALETSRNKDFLSLIKSLGRR